VPGRDTATPEPVTTKPPARMVKGWSRAKSMIKKSELAARLAQASGAVDEEKARGAEEQTKTATATEEDNLKRLDAPEAEEKRLIAEQKRLEEPAAVEICATTTHESLLALKPAFFDPYHENTEGIKLWLIWSVHRVKVNDPSLVELDLSCYLLPAAEDEPRIIPKLFEALGDNTHLKDLHLCYTNLRGDIAVEGLTNALRRNHTLRQLNVESNSLIPRQLVSILSAACSNPKTALEAFRCQEQLEVADPCRETFMQMAQAMEENMTLIEVGLWIDDPHWRDQIFRTIIRNREQMRKLRGWRPRRSGRPGGA